MTLQIKPRPIYQKGQKPAKSGKDPKYLAAIHSLPCAICFHFGMAQNSPTQAHHTICGRYSGRKTPDRQAIPLCEGHHQGDFDTSKLAIHRDKALWMEWYGPDTDFIAWTQDQIARGGDDLPF